jgi:hypothetical protein
MIADPGQGIVAQRFSHTISSTGLLGVADQVNVTQDAKDQRHEHVSRPTTVDAANPSSYPAMEGRVVDHCGRAPSRLYPAPSIVVLGYFSVTPELLGGFSPSVPTEVTCD